MKKYIILLLLLLPLILNAQSKFQTTHFSIRDFNDSTQRLLPWREWYKSEVIISIDSNTSKISIFSEKDQEYTRISEIYSIELGDRNLTKFDAIDIKGNRCTVEIVHFIEKNIDHLYIRWSNFQIVYQMYKL